MGDFRANFDEQTSSLLSCTTLFIRLVVCNSKSVPVVIVTVAGSFLFHLVAVLRDELYI